MLNAKHLETFNLARQSKTRIISDRFIRFLISEKIKIFQRDIGLLSRTFCHFPYLKKRIDACCEKETEDREPKAYKNILKAEVLDIFQPKF